MASELIRSEYQGLLKGIRENDTEEKKMTDKETTEKKELQKLLKMNETVTGVNTKEGMKQE